MVKTLVEYKKNLGYGIGLRRPHFEDILKTNAQLPDWFEIISENFMTYGGKPKEVLKSLSSRNIPLVAHSVGLSIGSTDEFNDDFKASLKKLLEEYDTPWFSDHLCFSSTGKHQFHDLLPLLRTDKTLEAVIAKIKIIENYFERPFAIENISYYGESDHNTIEESDFLNEILSSTNSFLLLDINNIYVNSINHHFDAKSYLDRLDLDKVIQVHLAGHWDRGDLLIDTHGNFIDNSVWDLYSYFIKSVNSQVSTLIEWDNDIPSYTKLLAEANKAKTIALKALSEQ